MFISMDRIGTAERLQDLLIQAAGDERVAGILVLACEENGLTPQMIDEPLRQCQKPVFGGIFQGIILNNEKFSRGTIVAGVPQSVITATIDDIDRTTNFDLLLEQAFETQTLRHKTLFVFVDGLSRHISRLIESMSNCYGLLPNYIGGGAGSLSGKKPCVISNKGLLTDAAVFALTNMISGIGVTHGWKPVAGPLKVTEADHHTIISLNWRPAFQVYRETVEEISGISFNSSDFLQLAKGFPFGILKLAGEMVVRDPILVKDNKLICVGEVPVNSLVYILKGYTGSLIAGAAKARVLAEECFLQRTNCDGKKPDAALFMDCVSRVLFLQSDFHRELEMVQTKCPLLGALTLGEIANTAKSYLEFYNKTTVIGLLGEQQ